MKGGKKKEIFPPKFSSHRRGGGRGGGMKEEDEEKSVSGDPFVVVKLEDEKSGQEADRSEQPPGCGSGSGSAPDISLFAPIDSSEDAEEERPWELVPDEVAGSSQRHWRGLRKRVQSKPWRDPAAESRTRTRDQPPDQAPPEKRAKSMFSSFPSHMTARSAVWEYYEYFINHEGELEDYGFPMCKLCQVKVACKRGNTSNMLRHLQENHTGAYKEVKKVDGLWLDRCAVEKQSEDDDDGDTDDSDIDDSDTDKSYRNDSDTDDSDTDNSVTNNNGTDDSVTDDSENDAPASPRQKWQFGSLSLTLPKENESNKLYPPSTPRKSAVWKLFGFGVNRDGVLEENDFPICRLCHQAVASKGGTTSNMYSHLQHHHHAVYIELKNTVAPAGTKQTLDLSEGTELHPPVKRKNSPVWKYFGFLKNAQGELMEDGFPVCRMCHQKVAAKDGATSNMIKHLRRHHQAEYEDVKSVSLVITLPEGDEPIKLYPPSTARRATVWKFFGFVMNSEGLLEENDFPICRLCYQVVPSKDGKTFNMYSHLQHHHHAEYTELRKRVAPAGTKLPLDLSESTELHPPVKYRNLPVWQYFGFLKNAAGDLIEDGFPVCTLCHRRVAAKDGATSNMAKHLRRHHQAEYEEVKKAAALCLDLNSDADIEGKSDEQDQMADWCGEEKQSEEEDGDEGDLDDSEYRVSPPPRRKRQVRSEVWKYFRYNRDKSSSCKICGWKPTARSSGSTSNMRHHLQSQHQIMCPSANSAGNVLTLPDGDEPIKLYPPSTPRKSAVWKLFGFAMNSEGLLEENDFPICRLCHKVVASKGGTTSNMSSHLQHHHHVVYAKLKNAMAPAEADQTLDLSESTELHPPPPEEVKLANSSEERNDLPELFSPTIVPRSPIWDYFGYPKNAEGAVEETGRPKCKACRQSIVSKQGILSNMLRHLKFYHDSLYGELKSRTGGRRPYKKRSQPQPSLNNPAELYPPKMALKSGVWKHFGYLKNSKGMVVPNGFPICKLCLRKVSTPNRCTTNMMVHLQRYHTAEFAEIRPSSEDKDEQTQRETADPSPLSELCPPQDTLEPVWEHFGYPRNADGVLQVDGKPTCKICRFKVSAPGENTKFLYKHLWKNHNAVYFDVKVATRSLRREDGSAAPVLFPPTQRVKSVAWEYFGYLKDADGVVICDGFPICKICYLNVAAKGGNTTNLFKHLKDHHQSVYGEARAASSKEVVPDLASSVLYAPDEENSKLWEYFEYLRNEDGTLIEDGVPACKICGVKVTLEGESTSNMMKHLQENHEEVHAEVQEALSNPSTEDAPKLPELHPPTQTVYPIWEYFGFLKDSEGSVVFDGFPICKICRRKVEAKDGDTGNMFHHLRVNHLDVYQQIKPADDKQVHKSIELSLPCDVQIDIRLWEHFGYPKNSDGEVEEDGAPSCKICHQKLPVSSSEGNVTTSMLRHLQRNHQSVYEELQEAIGAWKPEWNTEKLELYPPSQNVTSPVWEHFGYLKDMEGSVVCDGFPICKICHQKVPSKGGNTSNMFKHLKDCHQSVYNEIRSAVTNKVFEDVQSAADLHPPSTLSDPTLWEHFGYRRSSDEVVEEDGAPFCKLCLRKLVSRGEMTKNMKQHLKENHNTVYTETEQEVLSSVILELDPGNLDLHPPTQKVKSAVWKFFGYPRDAEGSVLSDGFPTCKLCQKKVSAKGGNTTNMFTHLKDYHRTTYNKIRATVSTESEPEHVELHTPTTDALSPVWKYFGYPKNTDGSLACDGHPSCRLCQLKVTANGGKTSNMLMHLRAYHLDVYKEVKPAIAKNSICTALDLYPPSGQGNIKLWDHFGYPKSADGELNDDGAPICKICLRKMIKPSTGGSPTSNMLRHLRKKHQLVYDEVQEAITTLRTEWGIEPPELHPPTQNVTSAVWQYFGYLKDGDGSVVCDDFPICKLCQQKVASKGRCTTNMFKHLKEYHRAVYDEARCAVTSEKFEDVSVPTDLHPPSGQYNPKLWEHFGYRKEEEGNLVEDGAPICKLCLRKLISKGETTANMMQHLKQNHNAIYGEVQREVNPFTIGGATESPELHPPEHKVRSGIWKHFGYVRDEEGPADCAGFPICKICLSKVSNKGKVTANMTAHLKDHHRSVYDELKIPDRRSKAVLAENLPELYPPLNQPLSPIWEHFGFPKNSDGAVEEDGCPVCRICGKKVSSPDRRKMLRHLHYCHFSVYKELKSVNRASKLGVDEKGQLMELHPPSKSVRSFVWKHFGYLKNPDGTVNVDGRPICKTCFQKVSSHGGNTTNMFKHLEDKHGLSQ